MADLATDYASLDPLGRHLRRRPDDGAVDWGVRRRRRGLGQLREQDRDDDAASGEPLRQLRPRWRLCARNRAGAARARRARLDDPAQPASRSLLMSIHIRNVSKRFGEFAALDDVSLEVESGSLSALLGPSGSGKSTLLRVIAGLERPDGGEVLLSGEDATHVVPQERGVGFVFQHYAAFKHMTVWDNVAFGLTIRRAPRTHVRERVAELLELVQLSGLAKRYPAQLSGGQRQRMGLGRAP